MSSANAQSGTALTNTAPVASKTPARQAIQHRCSPHRNIGPAPQQNTTSATDLANAARDFGPSTPCPSAANHKRVPLRAKPTKRCCTQLIATVAYKPHKQGILQPFPRNPRNLSPASRQPAVGNPLKNKGRLIRQPGEHGSRCVENRPPANALSGRTKHHGFA